MQGASKMWGTLYQEKLQPIMEFWLIKHFYNNRFCHKAKQTEGIQMVQLEQLFDKMGAIGLTFNSHQMAILQFEQVFETSQHLSYTHQKLSDFEIGIDRRKLMRPCMNIVLIKRYLIAVDSKLYVSNRDPLISHNEDLLSLRMKDAPIWNLDSGWIFLKNYSISNQRYLTCGSFGGTHVQIGVGSCLKYHFNSKLSISSLLYEKSQSTKAEV